MSAHGATVAIQMVGDTFNPSTKTVNVGDTVTWVNADFVQHTSTSGANGVPDGKWDSPFLNNAGTFSHTFDAAGTYPYFCRPHFFIGMRGKITVQGAAAEPPTVGITSPANNATFQLRRT